MHHLRYSTRGFLSSCLWPLLASCSDTPSAVRVVDRPPASAAVEQDPGAEKETSNGAADRGVTALYNDVPDKMHPAAEALCLAFREYPQERRASCAGSRANFMLTDRCRASLGRSVADGAIRIDEPAASSCLATIKEIYSGCGWLEDSRVPRDPQMQTRMRSCAAALRGTLKRDARCRSSLECQDELHCAGVSPTTMGNCRAPGVTGEVCGRGVDPLLAWLRPEAMDQGAHKECAGFCANTRCYAHAALGDKCVSSLHCGPAATCNAGRICERQT